MLSPAQHREYITYDSFVEERKVVGAVANGPLLEAPAIQPRGSHHQLVESGRCGAFEVRYPGYTGQKAGVQSVEQSNVFFDKNA